MRIALFVVALAANPVGGCPGERPAGATEAGPAMEGWSSSTEEATPAPAPADPGVLACGDLVQGDTSDPATAGRRFDAYSCNVGNYDAAERVYEFRPTFYGTASFSLVNPSPSEIDHDVMVLTADGTCLEWGGNSVDFYAIAGDRLLLVVDGFDEDEGDFEAKLDCDPVEFTPPSDGGCAEHNSTESESAPIQLAAALPAGANALDWAPPTSWTSYVAFAGDHGSAATHEGIDYIHGDEDVATVPVRAAGDGVVAYVRTGCPQSTVFGANAWSRECGAGWGNHVIVEHGNDLYTRYAHLEPGDVAVRVGNAVARGDILGGMGNSGRSQTRHLHFELGSRSAEFDSCEPAQSFDAVHDPGPLL